MYSFLQCVCHLLGLDFEKISCSFYYFQLSVRKFGGLTHFCTNVEKIKTKHVNSCFHATVDPDSFT